MNSINLGVRVGIRYVLHKSRSRVTSVEAASGKPKMKRVGGPEGKFETPKHPLYQDTNTAHQ